MPKQWFVGITKQGQETYARLNLERQRFETYLPMYICVWGKIIRPRPFLPSYIFISLSPGNEQWRCVLSTFGMRGVLTSGERPSPIHDWIIEDIKARERDGLVQLPPKIQCKFRKGDKVSIKGSPVDALFDEVVDRRRGAVFLSLLGRSNRLVLPLSKLSSPSSAVA